MRIVAFAVIAVAALAGPLVGQGQEDGRPEGTERRERLEQEVRQRFMEHVTRRLQLTDSQEVALRCAAI